MMENGRGLIKALENWAKKVTTGYQNVDVRDLSTSFRDGMAFCAIIHHYRPDLIDFDSLSKENIYENNSTAFSVAEKQLGVPALLDAEDMVKYARPDRLSIITYLSQLRNCFENQNKVRTKTELKRIQSNTSGPPTKISGIEPSLISPKRHEICQNCKHRVFILERLIVDGKLYHTTCFRCHKCNCLLNRGAYVESDTPGKYECSVCLTDELPESPKIILKNSIQMNDQHHSIMPENEKPRSWPPPRNESIANNKLVNFARSNLSPESQSLEKTSPLLQRKLPSITTQNIERSDSNVSGSESPVSVKDKIHVFEKGSPSDSSLTSPPTLVSPVPRIRQSLLLSKFNEESSILSNDSLSQQSGENSEKLNSSKKNDADIISATSPVKSLESSDTLLHDKINSNIDNAKLKSTDEITDGKSRDSDINRPIADNSQVSSVQSENRIPTLKSIYSVRTLSGSPKVPRDIFKSSLQPLKIPSLRKGPTSPDTVSQSNRNFAAPSLGVNISVPVPKIRRNLSLREESVNNTTDNLESKSLSEVIENKVRRSSLESKTSDGVTKFTDESVNKPVFKDSNRTTSVQEIRSFKSSETLTSNNTEKEREIRSRSTISSSSLKNTSHEISEESKSSERFPSLEDAVKQDKLLIKELPSKEVIKDDELEASRVEHVSEPEEEDYPDDMNPFGDDEEEEGEVQVEVQVEEYPDDLNPFGDDDEEENKESFISASDYDESKNPFASDDDDYDDSISQNNSDTSKTLLFDNRSASFVEGSQSGVSSPSSSTKGTLKKRPAPKPPASVLGIFSKDSDLDVSVDSAKSSPSSVKRNFQASSPKVRKNKPAPPPPSAAVVSAKVLREADDPKTKQANEAKEENPRPQLKKKKRPAPPVPIPKRQDNKKIPLKEIIQEMREIELKQREYEKQGREIEILIRDRDKDQEPSVEEEEYIMQLFELVNQKNALFRRQAELMYIKRSQRLEEQQEQIEKEIRSLMEKPESEKTEEDKLKEEELTLELIDIVDQRNSIIDSIEMDRRRELEEDHSVNEQTEIKNGDLPIPAEIKQKTTEKVKKSKPKKEKKKQEAQEAKKEKKKHESKKEKKKQEELDSGKGTLKRIKFFSKSSGAH